MTSRLRVIKPGEGDGPPLEISMAEAIEAVAKECAAANPVSVLISWEAGGKIISKSIPNSRILEKGFILTLHELVFPPDEEDKQ